MDTKETSIYYYFILAAVLIGIIIFYFILSLFKQQKKYRELNNEKVNAEINTLEAERKRVASDLHDELGPVLSSAKNILQSIENLSSEDLKLQEEAIGYIDISISKIRQIAKSLMPNSLVRKSLPFAIQEFINFSLKKNLIITFTHANVPSIPENKAIQIYRIVQEIIQNTMKHSKASELLINMKAANNTLLIQTADNGCGYDHEAISEKANGLGLLILKSRISMLSAEMHVLSKKGKGTRYVFNIPI